MSKNCVDVTIDLAEKNDIPFFLLLVEDRLIQKNLVGDMLIGQQKNFQSITTQKK